jgi:hypothetical protein
MVAYVGTFCAEDNLGIIWSWGWKTSSKKNLLFSTIVDQSMDFVLATWQRLTINLSRHEQNFP